MKKETILTLMAFLFLSISAAYAGNSESNESKIARAMKAAPSDISANATIIDVDGKVLRKGTNRWTCLPGVSLIPGDKHPMCNDKVWMKWMKAAKEGVTFTTSVIGISYMLQGDGLVSNDNPAETDKNKGTWVKEGPHMMMLMPTNMLADLPRDPYSGGPYVMWDKTPLVHVMVPVKTKLK